MIKLERSPVFYRGSVHLSGLYDRAAGEPIPAQRIACLGMRKVVGRVIPAMPESTVTCERCQHVTK